MERRNISTTFMKGIDVLRSFGDGAPSMTMADIAKHTGFDRATTRRLCLTLVEAGLMRQSGRDFMLSPRILTLAESFLRANDFGRSVQPVLNSVAEELRGEVGLATRDEDHALYVAQSATVDARVSLGLTIGSTIPLMTTAAGRMLLASIEPARLSQMVESLPLFLATETTQSDREEIKKHIQAAAKAGYVIVKGEYEPGICGLAVPVGLPGQVRAVLGTTLSLGDHDLDRKCETAISALQVASAKIRKIQALESWPCV